MLIRLNSGISKQNIKQTASGLTLIELMVVISIIGIVSAFAIPWLFNPEHKAKKVARGLFSDMQQARIGAIKQGRPFRIEFDASNNSYSIVDSQGDKVVKTVNFTGYAEYSDGSGGTNPITYGSGKLSFNSRGTCNAGNAYIRHRNAAYKVGTLSTGIIRMQRWTGGEWK